MKNQNRKIITVISALLVTGGLFLVGCGGSGNNTDTAVSEPAQSHGKPAPANIELNEGKPDTSSAAKQPSTAMASKGEVKKIELSGNDRMKYDIDHFEVKAGQTVVLTFSNVGTMPKISMGHNVVILKQGSDVNEFVNAAMMHARNDYIPENKRDQIIAATKLLGPKESDTITFTAPSKPGEYDYICTFPGHLAVGMRGIMKVTD